MDTAGTEHRVSLLQCWGSAGDSRDRNICSKEGKLVPQELGSLPFRPGPPETRNSAELGGGEYRWLK